MITMTCLIGLAVCWLASSLSLSLFSAEAGMGIDINATRNKASAALGWRFLMDVTAMLSSNVDRVTF
jgi:hypothetical protein